MKVLPKAFSFFLVAVLLLTMFASLILPAYASSPSFTNKANPHGLNVSTLSSGSFTPTVGDIVVVNIQYGNTAGVTISNVSAGAGATHNTVYSDVNLIGVDTNDAGAIRSIAMYSYLVVNGGAQSVVVTLSGTSGSFLDMEVVDVAPGVGNTISPIPICTSTGSMQQANPGSSVVTTGAVCQIPSNGVAFGGYFTFGTFAAGIGFTGYCATGITNRCTAYGVNSPLQSTNFQATTSGATNSWVVIGATFGTAPAGTQSQNIGSCPTKNTGTFTMVNNTIYMYYGNALGSEVVNTVQTSVASITGSGSHTLKMLVYVSSGQSANVGTPLVLAYQQSIVISSGTTNNVITFQVNIPLNTAVANPLPFNLWGVGIVGDNKIKINQSSLSGLFTQTGSASTANQPLSFTSQGTSVGTMLYLCATASYQSVLPAVTTTTTQAATTTSTAFTTSTATISTIGATLFTTSSNWPVIFLILLLPAGLFLGVTKTIAGAILGLVVGSVIGELMGILPTFVFVGLVISLIAVAFVARNREGG